MNVLAIDPGTTHSAFVVLNSDGIASHGFEDNQTVRDWLAGRLFKPWPSLVACEMIASYGMPVGRETFETCLWIGRFMEARPLDSGFELIFRKDIKIHLCGSMRAKDANIRQALIDRLGPQGTKKAPGPTYGIKSHVWAALAVGVYARDKFCNC